MVFIASFLLMQSFIVPAFGENRQARKRLKKRLQTVVATAERQDPMSLVRRKHLGELSGLERAIESLPGMVALERLIEQAGREDLAYRLVLKSLALAAIVGLLVFSWKSSPL